MKTEQREIKFRAWDVQNSVMIKYGCFSMEQFPRNILKPEEIRQRVSPFYGIESGEMICEDSLNAWFLMQYTGIRDINENEIYEGDIVSILDKTSREKPYIGEVKWNELVTGFECRPSELQHGLFLHNPNPEQNLIDELKRFMRYPRTIEIIGNIYEHPELLTK